jgi:integrase
MLAPKRTGENATAPLFKYICYTALFDGGERFPVLLYGETYQPVVLCTRYVIDERRELKQAGTIGQDVRVLRWFYCWADIRGIDLEERLRSGKLLTKAEISGFCKYLRAARTESIIGSIGANNREGSGRIPVISPATFNAYIGTVKDFLLWAAREFIPNNSAREQLQRTIESAIDRINRSFRSRRMSGKKTVDRRGLTRDEVDEIRRIIEPGLEANPFKRSLQLRNYLIFVLMLETGLRRGELLKLKVRHLPRGAKTTLSVERKPDDIDDPRLNEPRVKTLMREIEISKQLSIALWRYVRECLRKGSNSDDFLFRSVRDGLPLNSSGVNWLFSQIVKCLPHLKGRLSPHVMRHTYNVRLVETAQSMGWEEKRIEEFQRYVNGWSENSVMPSHYTKSLIQQQANEVARKYQESLYVF